MQSTVLVLNGGRGCSLCGLIGGWLVDEPRPPPLLPCVLPFFVPPSALFLPPCLLASPRARSPSERSGARACPSRAEASTPALRSRRLRSIDPRVVLFQSPLAPLARSPARGFAALAPPESPWRQRPSFARRSPSWRTFASTALIWTASRCPRDWSTLPALIRASPASWCEREGGKAGGGGGGQVGLCTSPLRLAPAP